MKQKALLFLLLLASVCIYGQSSVEGKIAGENNQPLAKATVALKQKGKTCIPLLPNDESVYSDR